MRIWLVNIGEQTPTKGGRLFRTGLLAHALADCGHRVTWWASSFDHIERKHRVPRSGRVPYKQNIDLLFLRGQGYSHNISVSRLIDHLQVAYKFAEIARGETAPDLIVSTVPAIELAYSVTRYACPRKIPVVVDIRDLWPDIFPEVAPRIIRPLVHLGCVPFNLALRYSCAKAAAIYGITEHIVEWGVKKARRERRHQDCYYPHAYSGVPPDTASLQRASDFWAGYGFPRKDSFNVCFTTSAMRHVDMDTVAEAARILLSTARHIHFLIIGNLEQHAQLFRDLPNVTLTGWVGRAELWTGLRESQVGLISYENRLDFKMSYPNKSIEYLSAGLPVISSLHGALEDLLRKHRCGLTFDGPEELAKLLSSLSETPETLVEMKLNATRLFLEQFVSERIYAKMCQGLEAVARDRHD